jgi:hypothetical protein
MWRGVIWYTVTDISEESTSIFRELFYPEDGGNDLPGCTVYIRVHSTGYTDQMLQKWNISNNADYNII